MRRRTQPPGCQPGTRNHELAPAAVETDADIGKRTQGRMTQRAGSIPVEANLSRDQGDRRGLALRTDHRKPHTGMTSKLKPRRHWDRYQHYADSRSHFKKKIFQPGFPNSKAPHARQPGAGKGAARASAPLVNSPVDAHAGPVVEGKARVADGCDVAHAEEILGLAIEVHPG